MYRDVLVDGYTMFVTDPERSGVDAAGDGGLYHRDVRHLSELTTTVEGTTLATLGREMPRSHRRVVVTAETDSAVNRVDDTDQKRTDLVGHHRQAVTEGDGLVQDLELHNHSSVPYAGRVAVTFDVDFADVFEVRGYSTPTERDVDTTTEDRSVEYAYEYADADGRARSRTTSVTFDRVPSSIRPGRAVFDVSLAPQDSTSISTRVRIGTEARDGAPALSKRSGTAERVADRPVDVPEITTGSSAYDRVFARAAEDLAALTTETAHGPVALAGAPWFATVFGRDSLITAYQAIHAAPSVAAGTLRYLAAHQGTTDDRANEEAPGKIFHETRDGELAHRNLIPHTPYYGSIDATPLWVALLAEHRRWTGSDDLVTDLTDSLEAALAWIESARDRHGDDPFLYYERSPNAGLLHKAWRDTPGSVQFPDGTVAEGPIASVEVQGYVYRALREAATLYEAVLDDPDRAATLRATARRFAEAFERAFWVPEREYYGVAVVGSGDVVPTPTSNVGHCLWAGVVDEDRAAAVADTLLSAELFSGWGVRTMATSADGYSPVSYHLGSVWPHDNSLVAIGLADYGHHEAAELIARGVLDACTRFDDCRIPELFCGFSDAVPPTAYPSSCVPQAWSAATPLAFLRALFDLSPTDGGVAVGATPDAVAGDAIDPITERWSE